MPLSMYSVTVPVFVQFLTGLSSNIDKAAAYATARKIDPAALITARLYPDMFPFSMQVQLASDFAKGTAARLAGVEIPKYEDNEKTFDELKQRIAKTIEFVKGFKPGQIDGSDEKEIKLTLGGNPVTMSGQKYLTSHALPNFFFHTATAYDILRHNGVELGKRDFMGPR
jgi:hypothetical protein